MGAYLYQLRSNDLNTQISRTSDLSNQISNLNSQIDSLRAQIQNLTSTTANLASQLDGLKTQVASLQAQVTQLQNQISQLQTTDQQQTSQIQQLQTQVQQLQALVQQLETEIQQLQQIVLNGAGSTMAFPFIAAASAGYTLLHTNVTIDFSAIGSGAGINALVQKTVDFAASDAPLSDAQRSAYPSILHIPETIGAVAIPYNIPGIPTGLNLNSTILAKIFQGQITSWNDVGIQQLNPSLTLPSNGVLVVHRSDGSGTTFVFTSYLQQSSSGVWTLGSGTTVAWPAGLGAAGNAGVAGVVQGTPYTIGYVEMSYALINGMKTSNILNADATSFVPPTTATATYAVANFTGTLPAGDQSWASVSLLNEPGKNSYPIASFTYILVYKDLSVLGDMTLQKAKALVNFLWYLVHQAQTLAGPLDYPPLPASVVAVDETTLRSMTFNGQTLLT